MSDVSRGPGWWVASDGLWYPPEQHPSRQVPAAAPPAPAFVDPMALPRQPTRVPRRNLVVWGLAVVVLLVAVLSLVLVLGSSSNSSDTLPTGTLSGTITITAPPGGQPTFEGTIDGKSLTGSVSAPGVSGSTATGVSFTYSGDFDGTSYTLHVTLDLSRSRSSFGSGSGSVYFSVTGTYGSAPIAASAQLTALTVGSGTSVPVAFHGTVGSQALAGAAVAREGSGHTIDVTARFAVH